MVPLDSTNIRSFLERLGERYPGRGTLYLLGGSALCLLGNPRQTKDIDQAILPSANQFDIAQSEARAYFEEVRRRFS